MLLSRPHFDRWNSNEAMPKDLNIHKNAYKGHADDVQADLDDGVDPNTPGAQGRAPLHKAVGGSHPNVVSLLLDAGATVDVLDKGGKTPIHWAALVNSTECRSTQGWSKY